MKRSKHRPITTTGKYFSEARQDKYWTQWAEKQVQKVQAEKEQKSEEKHEG